MVFSQDHGIFSLDVQSQGEKYIQLEKYGSAKVEKYRVGTELTFFANNEWRTEYIEDIISGDSIIVFTNGFVKLNKIEKLSLPSWKQKFFKLQEKSFYAFGASWAFFSLFDSKKNYKSNGVFAGSMIVTGFLLGKLARPKIVRLGKRKRLRLLEIDLGYP